MAESLPLFPLGTVLLPGVTLPLHIFEPRYRRLTVDLVTAAVPDRRFGVVAVREGWPADAGRDGLHPVGCTAELQDVRRLPDGRFDIVTRGGRRFRLLELDSTSKEYLTGSVEYLPDAEPEPEPELTDWLAEAARAAHRRYCAVARQDGGWSAPAADTDPATLPHLLAADCLLTLADMQLLLEQTSPNRRLQQLRAMLARETGLLTRLRAVPAPLTAYAVEQARN